VGAAAQAFPAAIRIAKQPANPLVHFGSVLVKGPSPLMIRLIGKFGCSYLIA
jgi:hypothetical protein